MISHFSVDCVEDAFTSGLLSSASQISVSVVPSIEKNHKILLVLRPRVEEEGHREQEWDRDNDSDKKKAGCAL